MLARPICVRGQYRDRIIERYEHYASNVTTILGPEIFANCMIEPDFVQYYNDNNEPAQEGSSLSGDYMARIIWPGLYYYI